ncbi:MAG: TIGR00296 family protein [Nitrosopumilaceae archaeon]|nr:TIGR00296 family protein [Nitrosopumilaceae archaeon]NIU01911.1 TIGR00296 family protein [Nitrosopumilaceae archaeon]NIU88315.1 TIGR00296 family protein [Nitrosopumilaceae archaeon]NIV66607.1 TIGR00296 family protein [Nitrosopumilaceae archaeon]NIX62512.1 TIGR00296 family protein [Nitrosopumilaceae archaeon]
MKESKEISEEQGAVLVNTARFVVTKYLRGEKFDLDADFCSSFSFNSGVFVTINKGKDLRGCIGYPMPDEKLYTALKQASIAAATEDPRFYPLSADELDSITFEVTVLTNPQRILASDPDEYPSKIKIGRDGLIVRYGSNSGLLLPQVPLEYGWSEKEFLNHTCEKAGLVSSCWHNPETEVFRFEGIVFSEMTPNGPIVRKQIE